MTRRAPPALRRRQFVMDDDDVRTLADLSRPRFLTLEDARTPQELANEFWELLGLKWGFLPETVIPDPSTKDNGTFLAVPLDPNYKGPPANDTNSPKLDLPIVEAKYAEGESDD